MQTPMVSLSGHARDKLSVNWPRYLSPSRVLRKRRHVRADSTSSGAAQRQTEASYRPLWGNKPSANYAGHF